tara:strand:- start:64 stop:450 length:387 start_codon:yes stop_codon:yes gene_type:complete
MVIKIIKYAGTNGVAFVADFTLLVILDYLLNIDRAYIAGFCYLLGTCVSFFLAKNFVFGKGWMADKPLIEFSAYFLGGVMGAVITAFMFYISVQLGITNILIQKIIATPIAFIIVFLYRNFIVFKDGN